jgi:hypothetical protein
MLNRSIKLPSIYDHRRILPRHFNCVFSVRVYGLCSGLQNHPKPHFRETEYRFFGSDVFIVRDALINKYTSLANIILISIATILNWDMINI